MVKTLISQSGEIIKEDLKRWLKNILIYTLPLFLGTLFAQLSQGVNLKVALSVSLLTLYGAISDFLKKRNEITRYSVK